MLSLIKDSLRFIWELPQSLLGMFLFLNKIGTYNRIGVKGYHIILISEKMIGGISLGKFIIISSRKYDNDPFVLNHELGHGKQSLYLGPLYLLVIGLPSLIHAKLHKHGDYYSFYTEKWADKLGHVSRYH